MCSESKSKHFESRFQLGRSKCDYSMVPLNNVGIDEIDDIYKLYLFEHDKKYDFYKIKVFLY